MVGESLTLECEVQYRGSMPQLQWFDSDNMEVELAMEDRAEIRLMKKALVLQNVSPDHDKRKYVCKLSEGQFMDQCTLTLDIKRKLYFHFQMAKLKG